jgi:hypothetical protein
VFFEAALAGAYLPSELSAAEGRYEPMDRWIDGSMQRWNDATFLPGRNVFAPAQVADKQPLQYGAEPLWVKAIPGGFGSR